MTTIDPTAIAQARLVRIQRNEQALAHLRESDHACQTLPAHLIGVGRLSSRAARKIEIRCAALVIGLLHDLGKYSEQFQSYLKSATGLIESDQDDYVDAAGLRGKIDHSTAGAQYVWRALAHRDPSARIAAQAMSLCIASHHSGLIDCLGGGRDNFGKAVFVERMKKAEQRAHLDEVTKRADRRVLARCDRLLASGRVEREFHAALSRIGRSNEGGTKQITLQQFGLLLRMLFSCLIDADRTDTADFEHRRARHFRPRGNYTPWNVLIARLDQRLAGLGGTRPIDSIRAAISADCLAAATRPTGVYSLTVPTGGGKTLASLRFALHHAQRHNLDRVIYIVPFTSIIDQNARVTRGILEPEDSHEDRGRVVLEHHSNLTPEQQTWREKVLSENWDAPVVYTTMVQFLECLFGAGTRGARRMHQLARAVIVLDEAQALPIKCVHLFNNAINFLASYCGSTVVLCTATQPLLDQVAKDKGAIRFAENRELVSDVEALFARLKRVEVRDERRPGGWSVDAVAELALRELRARGSCLVIVNTKRAARELFERCAAHTTEDERFHLSTDMCPAHRKRELAAIAQRLGTASVLCVSTQLIEAGVDVDFAVVVRYLAGLDSIAQAAGRCNRNGRPEPGTVHVVNPADENLDKLPDIRIGRDKAERVLDDFRADPARYGHDLFGPQAMSEYYSYYFFSRQGEMSYPVPPGDAGQSDTLLNLLSENAGAVQDYKRVRCEAPDIFFRQAFMTAAEAFKAIDAPTQGVIVPHGPEGRDLIAQMCAAFDIELEFALMRRAQQYTVNLFPHVLQKLQDVGAVHAIKDGARILCLNERYYSPQFGVATEPVAMMENLNG